MTAKSDPGPILYASISHGTTILADLLPAGTEDLSSLAAICLDCAPQLHLLYTHTTNSRIYAFLFSSPLIFFAIADDSLGRPSLLLFLHLLRDATTHIFHPSLTVSRRCLQDELLPIIRRLALQSVEEKPIREEGIDDSRGGEEDDVDEADLRLGLGGRKSVERIWWQQVRMVLIIDLVVCSLLFGVWLSVCKGFECIGG